MVYWNIFEAVRNREVSESCISQSTSIKLKFCIYTCDWRRSFLAAHEFNHSNYYCASEMGFRTLHGGAVSTTMKPLNAQVGLGMSYSPTSEFFLHLEHGFNVRWFPLLTVEPPCMFQNACGRSYWPLLCYAIYTVKSCSRCKQNSEVGLSL